MTDDSVFAEHDVVRIDGIRGKRFLVLRNRLDGYVEVAGENGIRIIAAERLRAANKGDKAITYSLPPALRRGKR